MVSVDFTITSCLRGVPLKLNRFPQSHPTPVKRMGIWSFKEHGSVCRCPVQFRTTFEEFLKTCAWKSGVLGQTLLWEAVVTPVGQGDDNGKWRHSNYRVGDRAGAIGGHGPTSAQQLEKGVLHGSGKCEWIAFEAAVCEREDRSPLWRASQWRRAYSPSSDPSKQLSVSFLRSGQLWAALTARQRSQRNSNFQKNPRPTEPLSRAKGNPEVLAKGCRAIWPDHELHAQQPGWGKDLLCAQPEGHPVDRQAWLPGIDARESVCQKRRNYANPREVGELQQHGLWSGRDDSAVGLYQRQRSWHKLGAATQHMLQKGPLAQWQPRGQWKLACVLQRRLGF